MQVDLDAQRRGKCVVLKTSTRQTIFLPVVGLVDADKLRPGDLVGVNKVGPHPCSCESAHVPKWPGLLQGVFESKAGGFEVEVLTLTCGSPL